MVVTSPPSAWTARTVQDFTDSPSRSTVQAPHEVVSQPTLVPVRPRLSRIRDTRRVRGSTSRRWARPFTVIATGTGDTDQRIHTRAWAPSRVRQGGPPVPSRYPVRGDPLRKGGGRDGTESATPRGGDDRPRRHARRSPGRAELDRRSHG